MAAGDETTRTTSLCKCQRFSSFYQSCWQEVELLLHLLAASVTLCQAIQKVRSPFTGWKLYTRTNKNSKLIATHSNIYLFTLICANVEGQNDIKCDWSQCFKSSATCHRLSRSARCKRKNCGSRLVQASFADQCTWTLLEGYFVVTGDWVSKCHARAHKHWMSPSSASPLLFMQKAVSYYKWNCVGWFGLLR